MRSNNLLILFAISCSVSPIFSLQSNQKTYFSFSGYRPYHLVDPQSLHRYLDNLDYEMPVFMAQAYGFYNKSANPSGLGRYFSPTQSSKIFFEERVSEKADAFFGYFIHQGVAGDSAQTLKLRPEYKSSGIVLAAMGKPSCFGGLSFSCVLPVVSVKTSLNPVFCGSKDDRLQKYFFGEFEETENSLSLQTRLSKGLFHKGKRSAGIADVELAASYVWAGKRHQTRVGVGVLVPTGNKPQGLFLFEPVYGHGGHWGLGWFCSSTFLACKGTSLQWCLSGQAEYRHLFDVHQKRILGIKGYPFGSYVLLGKKGSQNEPLIPAVNVTTMEVSVTGANHLELLLSSIIHHERSGLGLEIGFSTYLAQAEKVKSGGCWPEQTYAVADENFDTRDIFGDDIDNFDTNRLGDYIREKDLDFNGAAVSSTALHKVFLTLYGSLNPCNSSCTATFHITGFYEKESAGTGIAAWGLAGGFTLIV